MTKEQTEKLLNAIIDELCEDFGVIPTITLLSNLGVTKAELIKLKFDEKDIESAGY